MSDPDIFGANGAAPNPGSGGHCSDDDGAALLDDLRAWLARFIVTNDGRDLDLLALWIAHTHFLPYLYSTPRLIIDSVTFGAGKTTVLEHIERLGRRAVLATSITASAISRLPSNGPRVMLIDEADRTLSARKDGVEELLALVNGGYRRGGKRILTEPQPDGSYREVALPLFSAVAMAGNSPDLPDDTRSRSIDILLLPAGPDAQIEDSDWFFVEDDARRLRDRLTAWADRDPGSLDLAPPLPPDIRSRGKDVWRPLMTVALAAGGGWPDVCASVAVDCANAAAEMREAAALSEKPSVAVLRHIAEVWPDGAETVRSTELCSLLAAAYPDAWGATNRKTFKELTPQALGRMLSKGYRILTKRVGPDRDRVYVRDSFNSAMAAMGIDGWAK